MKQIYKSIFIPGLLLILGIMACEYDVQSPLYYGESDAVPAPVISSIVPTGRAAAGANHIQLIGENFAPDSGRNLVYFDGIQVDVLNYSATSLTVRRPNLVSDGAMIKLVSYDALIVEEFGPYQIDPVVENYGGFIEGNQLSDLAVSADGTVYVVQRTPRTVFKVTADGVQSELGEASRIVTDARMAPQGQLILMMNNKTIMQMDVTTGEETEWISLPKKVSYGDFDANGNFYTAGKKSGMIVVRPDLSVERPDFYSRDEVLGLRVYENELYVLAEIGSPADGEPELGVWKHAIADAAGFLGEAVLVLDWAAAGDHADSEPTDLTFGADGKLYISSTHTHPVLIVNPDGSLDILYKEILSSTAEKIVWSNGNWLYQIAGGENWDLHRINMGAAGAPYWGR